MMKYLIKNLGYLAAFISTGATAQEWVSVGRNGGEALALSVESWRDTGDSRWLLSVSVDQSAREYSQQVVQYNCLQGTRWERGRTIWSANADPVRIENATGTIRSLQDYPELAGQFDLICNSELLKEAPRFKTIDDFVKSITN